MSRRASRVSIIGSIVLKDLREYSRDRLWIILTPVMIVFVIVIFWVLPNTVDETIAVGIYPSDLKDALAALGDSNEHEAEGIKIVTFDDENRLVSAVSGELKGDEEEDVAIGIAFPPDFLAAIQTGEKTKVSVYVDAAVPAEIRRAMTSGIREIAYRLQAAANGEDPEQALPVIMPDEQTIVLGEDRAGMQVPVREKLRPMLAILILMIEALALAGLVAVEIEQRTVTALLVTPAKAGDVLAAKSITGAILALSQVLIFLIATQSFGDNWLLVIVLMLLGAVMFSAVGMIAGAAGKDFMSTLFYSIFFILPLMIPAFAVLFPGSAALWIKTLPSYGIIEAMVGAIGYGRGWSEVAPHIGTSLVWDVVLFGAALIILKRKVETL